MAAAEEDVAAAAMDTSLDSPLQALEDPEPLIAYLAVLCPVALGFDPVAFSSFLDSGAADESLMLFATDEATPVLVIQKKAGADVDGGAAGVADAGDAAASTAGASGGGASFSIQLTVSFESRAEQLVFVKRAAVLTANEPMSSQLRFTQLDDNPPEALHALLHHGYGPLFASYVTASEGAVEELGVGVGLVRKRLGDLELALAQLEQEAVIPEVALPVDPEIRTTLERCRASGKRMEVRDLGERAADASYLNGLGNLVNRWVVEIQKVTKLERDPSQGSAVQEIGFWLSMERALANITEQLKAPEIVMTLETLKAAKRFHATVSFESDTHLASMTDTVASYNLVMKEFPINELLAADELTKVAPAIKAIFGHLKKLRNSKYPVARALLLVEAISRALVDTMLKILAGRRLLVFPYAEFELTTSEAVDIFATWDGYVTPFKEMAREIARKRPEEKGLPIRVHNAHNALAERIDELRAFRQQHEQLRAVIRKVLPSSRAMEGEINALEEVNAAYDEAKAVDGLDLSRDGCLAWEEAVSKYEASIDRVEAQITARLRDQLGSAASASEMFRVFQRFAALLFRPKIRDAIGEYEATLIERVRDDVRALEDKFTAGFKDSQAAAMASARDLPPVSAHIVWAKQIVRQLDRLVARVHSVLGDKWDKSDAGSSLKADATRLKSTLNTEGLFQEWVKETEKINYEVNGKVFYLTRGANEALSLHVNFNSQIITLFKEVRNLQTLDYRVPFNVQLVSSRAQAVYPFAMSVIETVRTYTQTCAKIDPAIAPLLAGHKADVQALLSDGFALHWESHRLDVYVKTLASEALRLEDAVEGLLVQYKEVDKAVESLGTCPLKEEELSSRLETVQRVVDALNFDDYTNLDAWVAELDARIEGVLLGRLAEAVRMWVTEFNAAGARRGDGAAGASANADGGAGKGGSGGKRLLLAGGTAVLGDVVHELVLRNQTLYLDPPVEAARAQLVSSYSRWLGLICNMPRIVSGRFDTLAAAAAVATSSSAAASAPAKQTYKALLARLQPAVLGEGYAAIEAQLTAVAGYVARWTRYQGLWDLDAGAVYEGLRGNLDTWMEMLVQIKQARGTFDTSDTSARFGCVVVDYAQVQAKVANKYDAWHKDALARFGSLLEGRMREFHSTIAAARKDLEAADVDSASTADAVAFITAVQGLRRRLRGWASDVASFRGGQRLLDRQRFRFPSNWLYFDTVEAGWTKFTDVLARKDRALQADIAPLRAKVAAEANAIESRIAGLNEEWAKRKPVAGELSPEQATAAIADFDKRVGELSDAYAAICLAQEALDLEASEEDKMATLRSELGELKAVWAELECVWAAIDGLKETAWLSVSALECRRALEAQAAKLRALPNRMKAYPAHGAVSRVVERLVQTTFLIEDMRSEAVRERHWKQLASRLGVKWGSVSSLSLGDVVAVDLLANETAIRDVLTIATGELALEEFLRMVREFWAEFELEMVAYKTKCRLIKGWDDLFAKLLEHLNSLAAMRASPFFRPFAEEADGLDERLSRVRAAFDVWIEVQRRWVYLDGIFSGSADIAVLLPNESARFRTVDAEYVQLMKKVAKAPAILEVVAIKDLQKTLDRLDELLTKIQRSLSEYLERQRAAFPRFYFVGDEDLLEIIGSSKDIPKIQKHFKKMFAGLAGLLLSEDGATVDGMVSGQGEEVAFVEPVVLADNPTIHEWLNAVAAAMRLSLAASLGEAVLSLRTLYGPVLEAAAGGGGGSGASAVAGGSAGESAAAAAAAEGLDTAAYFAWVDQFPAQLVTLATQCLWTESVEAGLKADGGPELGAALATVLSLLTLLAGAVLQDLHPNTRKKYEHLITELVHERDTIRRLMAESVGGPGDFGWLYEMRYYYNEHAADPLECLALRMANTEFLYGFEYLGIMDKLVQTPLTDRCYLTLTQALNSRMGGSPFGPAGTGKTETVKALGAQMGRFVLVFCCDENFDFQSMGRIFVGLCQVGAWGCFDEFNRLAERMLSAVSQQIQTISHAMKADAPEVELLGSTVPLNPNIGIFITMNPGYAGRSNLPDNLKQLFRSIAMTKPNKELIAQVMLYAQGFATAEVLAGKVVPLFKLCGEQLSDQSHYDFGLRSLKSVLVSAGNIKREVIAAADAAAAAAAAAEPTDPTAAAEAEGEGAVVAAGPGRGDNAAIEADVLIRSVCETLIPKLVAADIPLLKSLLSDVFPGCELPASSMEGLKAHIARIADERALVCGDLWQEKLLQLNQITHLNHGLMLVGPSGSGKSSAWSVLLAALEALDGVEGVSYVLDPKAISKDELYGTLDATTREWTDGLFTSIIRKIIDNVRGESEKRHWVIFDGDVDPEWVENMNSLLDDNKLLTLPNGERLALPSNVRIMFEVQDLRYATLATVSRCGMVWFSEETLTTDMILTHYLTKLRRYPVETTADTDDVVVESGGAAGGGGPGGDGDAPLHPIMAVQNACADILEPYFAPGGLVLAALDAAFALEQVMDTTRLRLLGALFSLVNGGVATVHEYNEAHSDFPLSPAQLAAYLPKRLVFALVWAFSGASRIPIRVEFGTTIGSLCAEISQPPGAVIDYEVDVASGEWRPWLDRVPRVDVDAESMGNAIIPTLDTVRHVEVLYSWLAEHKPLLLCGPPGSGKTMTLFSTLRKCPDYECVGINFSAATSPELILKTFEQKCEVRRTADGLVLQPTSPGKWMVVFCDEINLPAPDSYGTQRVITFLRQLVERGGYWRASDLAWVKLERIQFVGACNPPTDPGRTPLSHRFLRHAPLILCDYPAPDSLRQIYGTFARALLKPHGALAAAAAPLTECMVEFYSRSQTRFVPDTDLHQHYIYSPRELTRWVRGIHAAISGGNSAGGLDEVLLLRIWAHEGLRLFQDRLVTVAEREWTDKALDEVAATHFPHCAEAALVRPILFSSWLSGSYAPVDRDSLRAYIRGKLKVFYEEELDVPLVLFDEVLDNVLRIDRVFKQKQGHLLLIGQSGAGKTVLSRFVAWMNKLSVFTIRGSRKYSGEDFDNDLRTILRRAGAEGEKICFIFDESNIKDTGFLERMNTLLANGEIPGLFEGEDWTALMNTLRESSAAAGAMLDSDDELYEWMTTQTMNNLHVVFTMNPASGGFENRTSTSPALFNRCVLNWVGDWSKNALYTVGSEFTMKLDLDSAEYEAPLGFPYATDVVPQPPTQADAVVNAMVLFHGVVEEANKRLAKAQGRLNYATPRHFLDFIHHYVSLFGEKRSALEEQQRHLNNGLKKLVETEENVLALQETLASRGVELRAKQAEAEQKLARMVTDQQEAEIKKAKSQEIAKELSEQAVVIEQQRAVAMADLEKAEPAVQSAAAAVQGIKKSHLDEVRALGRPPDAVRLTLEAVCLLLGESSVAWADCRKVMKRSDFISSIVTFDTESITPAIREKMKAQYLSNPNFTYETVNKASQACGPLAKWAIAQVSYSDILDRVEPLRAELRTLEDAAAESQARQEELDGMIDGLERSIAGYKADYAALIAETQRIETEMAATGVKVERSTALLASLGSERQRWEAESLTFVDQMATVVGDVLLAAGFMAYSGFFDQSYRQALAAEWRAAVDACGVSTKPNLAVVDYLSTPDERLAWQADKLPADDLCAENAIMLSRFKRYPLVIDPSGQAEAFILASYAEQRIAKTSFRDASFMKQLESALRFGTPLLVQDVESIDPVLNPVLNRELRKTGGRTLIALGDQDIDFSPSFVLIMTTRDPSAAFAPDLCSRVTFVNFTVTPGSLQAQCLSAVLAAEAPDVDAKRTDLVRMQGAFRVRLRQLEADLLSALSAVEGSILDNDSVIATLETLKSEAAEINAKVAETDVVLAEVTEVSGRYRPMASACARVYFALEQLTHIHFLYQFSLKFFLSIFDNVLLHNPHLDGVDDRDSRLAILVDDLFSTVFARVARTLLHDDHLPFALLLAQIRVADRLPPAEFDVFLRGSTSTGASAGAGGDAESAGPGGSAPDLALPASLGLTPLQEKRLSSLAALETFDSLADDVAADPAEWASFLAAPAAEDCVPPCWNGSGGAADPVTTSFRELLVIKAVRPDRVLASATKFIGAVFGDEFLETKVLDLGAIVNGQVDGNTPVLLCSMPGYDASGRVDDLAAVQRVRYASIALGSAEGFELAEAAIAAAGKAGSWVLLKNVHLAPQWLVELEKKVHNMTPAAGFRLFMTTEIHPALPANLLRMSRVLVFEPPPGVKANLARTFDALPAGRMDAEPVERSRLYFLVAWLHAVCQERLRYRPLGWAGSYEYTDADLRCALDMMDYWIEAAAKSRANVDPERISWPALRALMGQSIYGGKIDNPFDARLLAAFLDTLFTPAAYGLDFVLVPGEGDASGGGGGGGGGGGDGGDGASGSAGPILVPQGRTKAEFEEWVAALPDRQTPTWLGLPSNAEMVLLTTKGAEVATKVLNMQSLHEDDDDDESGGAGGAGGAGGSGGDTRPAWMRSLHTAVEGWAALLPTELVVPATAGPEAVADPLFRCIERELQTGAALLRVIRRDLADLDEVLHGDVKQTNYIRDLLSNLSKGYIPQSWRRYPVPKSLAVSTFLVDLRNRFAALSSLASSADYGKSGMRLGSLFAPEAYITASRQAAAQSAGWSLEELVLTVTAGESASDGQTFVMEGFMAQGVEWADGAVRLTAAPSTQLPPLLFKWVRRADHDASALHTVSIPVYLNESRSELLFAIDLPAPSNLTSVDFYTRGVAIVSTLYSSIVS